ncbi:MAG: sigma-54-dependent Fis family transcriptional regulator [Gammaproteobacteria bacterium]
MSKPANGPMGPGRLNSVTGRMVISRSADNDWAPDLADLTERLRFSLRDGHIWLDTQRVVLIHLSTLTNLRSELIRKLGVDEARGFLARMGYASGCRDATLARKLRPQHSLKEALMVGPQLRAIQGIVSLQPIQIEADMDSGRFYAELTFSGSFEADAQIADFGLADRPICWMQVGYASGYASTFMGRTILFKELECRAAGNQSCRMIGKPVAEWDDIEEEYEALKPQLDLGSLPPIRRSGPAAPATREPTSCEELPADVVGSSAGFVMACRMLQKVANTNATVLFLGETGVGKEMFARMLHRMGDRAEKPFVAINCAAIPENLIESELFGVEKGAYTGAIQSRPGRFERAHGGTLFLDEVGTLTQSAQIKLLRAIQEQEIERVGDTQVRRVDVRIIAATNVDLREAVEAGSFREDLMFRLNVFPVRIPPLRERRDDIPALMEHFLERYSGQHKKSVAGFTQRAVDALYQYPYPGNIRELENLIERAVILVDDGQHIDLAHLFAPEDLQKTLLMKIDHKGSLQARPATDTDVEPESDALDALLEQGLNLEELEHRLMKKAVEQAGGKLAKAAKLLGLTRAQLAYRLKKYQTGGP